MSRKGLGRFRPKWAGGQDDNAVASEGTKGLNGGSRKNLGRRRRSERAQQVEAEVEIPVVQSMAGFEAVEKTVSVKAQAPVMGDDDYEDDYEDENLVAATPAPVVAPTPTPAPETRRPLINSTAVTSRSASGTKEMNTAMTTNANLNDVNDRLSVISAKMNLTNASIDVKEDIVIFGSFDGELVCENLIVKEGAEVSGSVRAKRIDVFGKLTGDIDARNIRLMSCGQLGGNVKCELFGAQPGASMKVNLDCDANEQLAQELSDDKKTFDTGMKGDAGEVVDMRQRASGGRG